MNERQSAPEVERQKLLDIAGIAAQIQGLATSAAWERFEDMQGFVLVWFSLDDMIRRQLDALAPWVLQYMNGAEVEHKENANG